MAFFLLCEVSASFWQFFPVLGRILKFAVCAFSYLKILQDSMGHAHQRARATAIVPAIFKIILKLQIILCMGIGDTGSVIQIFSPQVCP